MRIDNLNGLNPLSNLSGNKRVYAGYPVSMGRDEVIISEEAKEMLETQKLDAIAKETPDVRMDRIEAVREKLKDPNYFSAATIASTADKILSAYGL